MTEVTVEQAASNVTVAHVVERAGVSRRTFYEIFRDGEDCLLAALDDALMLATERVIAARASSGSWCERVRAGLAALLQFVDEEPCAGRLLVVESLGGGHRPLERRAGVLARLATTVEEGHTEAKGTPQITGLTAAGIVGGALSIIHGRVLEHDHRPMLDLLNPLMSMIVLPYLGTAAARRELAKPVSRAPRLPAAVGRDPLRDLGMRLTYRTVRVLMAVAATQGGSNRRVADGSGIGDQGQISKLLARLHGLGLIENTGVGSVRGAPNAWVLTDRGWEVQGALARNTA